MSCCSVHSGRRKRSRRYIEFIRPGRRRRYSAPHGLTGPGPRNALASAGCGGRLNKAYAEYRGIKTAFGLLAKADDLNTIKQRERRAARNNCAYHTHKLLQATESRFQKRQAEQRAMVFPRNAPQFDNDD